MVGDSAVRSHRHRVNRWKLEPLILVISLTATGITLVIAALFVSVRLVFGVVVGGMLLFALFAAVLLGIVARHVARGSRPRPK